MEYAKVQGAFVRGAAFREADMAARGAWVTLLAHCADQENGGRIVACSSWTDRQWLSRADLMRDDVDHLVRSELARWDGADLVLAGYDHVSEASFRTLAAANRQKALDRWERERGGAAGKASVSRRHDDDVPPAVPPASKTDAAAMPPASNSDATDRPTDRPTEQHEPPAAAGAPAPPPKGAPGAAAAASATRTEPPGATIPAPPAPGAGGDDNARLRVRLGRYGMCASPQATAEWHGLISERAQITRWTEVDAFLRHCAAAGRRRGDPMRFARQAAELADEWRNGVRPTA